ncbi:MAG: acyltransferase family protein [Isosphaeraceae bacterium]|nr:acyltransferase family protein [Isosphaeraceae bacterium]
MGKLDGRGERPAREQERARGEQAPRGGGPAEMGNALEVLRVATTLLVVLYHAALAYVAIPLRLTMWVVYDNPGHTGFDGFIYWVNGFAMPVFFLAAGISAPAACESRGVRVFLTHRANRLLRPLLFGCLTVLPLSYVLWGYGLMVTGRCTIDNILSWRFGPLVRHDLYGLGHLWFLEYLFLVCLVWGGGWSLRRVLSRSTDAPRGVEDGWIPRMIASPWRPLLFAVPTCLIFLLDSDTMLRVDNCIVPNLFRLLHYALFFTVGGWIAKVSRPKDLFIRHGTLYLVLSLVVFAALAPLLLRHAAAPLHGWARIAFCGLAALFPWLTVFGSLGVLLKVVQGRGPAMRFLTEGSFWIYIVHLPIVALAQLMLLPVALPGVVKFLIVSGVTVVLSLLSYEFIVRRSLVGEIVNGARKRTTKPGFLGPEFGWIASLGVLVLVFAGMALHYRVFFWGDNFHEEVPGQIYRSARLTSKKLEELVDRKGLRTLITFTSGGNMHAWFASQQKVCEAHHVELYPINLRPDRLPSPQTLLDLMATLDRAPRPILVQSSRGIDQSGFTVALAQLLGGAPVGTALQEFDGKFGQIGGPAHSPLARTFLAYQRSLIASRRPHSAQQFRMWVHNEYQPAVILPNTAPLPSDVPGADRGQIARGARRPVIVR